MGQQASFGMNAAATPGLRLGEGQAGGSAPSNTLRLQGAPLHNLLDQIEMAALNDQSKVQRDYRRWGLRDTNILVDMQQPGGTVTSLRYVCRDLSGSGVGILHGSFVYPGTRCIVHVPHPIKRFVPVPGVVARCRLMQRHIHEVGIKFRQPLSVREFVNVDPFEGRFSLEKIDAASLRGTVLHVEDSGMDRRLIRHMLQETSLNVVSAENAEGALARAAEPFDLILSDIQMPGMDGFALARAMREKGVQVPILMVSAERGAAIGEQTRTCGANGFVAKPLSREVLLAAVAEFLLLGPVSSDSCGPIFSSLPADDPLLKFVPEFIEELKQTAARLTEALERNDPESIRLICFQVMGASASLGLEPVGRAARDALQSVTASASATESARPIRDLAFACHRVRGREAA